MFGALLLESSSVAGISLCNKNHPKNSELDRQKQNKQLKSLTVFRQTRKREKSVRKASNRPAGRRRERKNNAKLFFSKPPRTNASG